MEIIEDVKASLMTNSLVLPALKYKSGGREWIAVTVQYKVIGKFIRTSTVRKKNQEIIKSEIINRFLDPKHKNEIKSYIKEEKNFTLPPITLVSYEKLHFNPIYLDNGDRNKTEDELLEQYGSLTGLVFVPLEYEFLCLDGNHRTAAIKELAEENPDFIQGSNMLMNIVYEKSKKKIRQDFVDVNKNAKATTPSINTLFNTRDRLSSLVSDLIEDFVYLKETTDLLANSISKNSKSIYTINNLKNAIVELSGTHSSSSAAINNVSRMLENKEFYDEIKRKSYEFFTVLVENTHIKECLNNYEEVPIVRTKSIITSGAGLVVCARVCGKIYTNIKSSEVQKEKITEIISWDWSRNNPFFKGILVNSEGGITPGQTVFTSAANKLSYYFNI